MVVAANSAIGWLAGGAPCRRLLPAGVTPLNACCHSAEARGISAMPSPIGITLAARIPSVE